ncbi:MAG: hydantoinase/oxoprolinase family protein [Alphaproteobacteria bacterium]|nr:hydantoinase/oxoprolinase family protein [Alphaproteobacteria bacterium]
MPDAAGHRLDSGRAATPGWRIGVDIGGTFTDLVAVDPAGAINVFKVPSVPADPAAGVFAALEHAAAALRLDVTGLLGSCAVMAHGSTIATNTLLEKKGARVGCLATEGFRDSLEIRRGIRENPWEHREPYPPVLVPRYLRRPVRGRIDADGSELAPLMVEDVAAACRHFRDEGVEAVAICLFNSFLDSRHERLVSDELARHWGGQWITLSSQLAPIMGEYERSSTAVMNAYVAPRTVGYLRALNDRLAALGLARPILMIQNNGGAVSVDQVAERPVTLLLSGPAAGVGALGYYARAIGSDDLISMEIGGTSCDVILMGKGKVAFTDQLEIDRYHVVIPSVEVHTIGAGGGTIAGVDTAGLLFVGPRGAGSVPGPACYARGGTEPTITDAQLVLGRLKPDTYAGGAVRIDSALAEQAIDRAVARPLRLSREDAAAGMIRLMDQKLLHAVQRISIERGHDPRRFTLVACGGAGPLHGVEVGRQLGCRRVYVPRLSGAFCALGMLHADVRHDYVRVHLDRLDGADVARMDGIFAELETQAKATLAREGFSGQGLNLLRALDLRYIGQQWDITVPVAGAHDPAAIRTAFEAEHDRLFGHIQPGGTIEITKLRVTGIGALAPLDLPAPAPATAPAQPLERRRIWIDEKSGWAETDVFDGAKLAPGHSIAGPAVVNEATTTVLIGPGDRLDVDAAGNFMIALRPVS